MFAVFVSILPSNCASTVSARVFSALIASEFAVIFVAFVSIAVLLSAIAVVRYTKTRGVVGDAVNDFAARLIEVYDLNGDVCGLRWVLTDTPQEYGYKQVERLLAEDKTVKEIVKITGLSKSQVYRLKQEIETKR